MKTPSFILSILVVALVGCAPPTGSGGGGTPPPSPPPTTNHDGSSSAPVLLTIGQTFAGKIGADGTADQTSYYRFNSGSNTRLELILTDDTANHSINGIMTQFSVSLLDETDSDQNRSGYLLAEGLRPVFEDLATNRNYTIVVGNDLEAAGTYNIKVAVYSDPNEGTTTSPATLNLNTAHDGTASNAGSASSYLKFNTGSNTSVTFNYDVHGLSLVLYDADTYDVNDFVANNSSTSNGSWTRTGLTVGTDYFLKLRPGVGMGAMHTHSVDYRLTIVPNP